MRWGKRAIKKPRGPIHSLSGQSCELVLAKPNIIFDLYIAPLDSVRQGLPLRSVPALSDPASDLPVASP